MPMLLSNASVSGSATQWGGGRGVFTVAGTFGGATVSLEYLGPDGTTWLPVGTGFTAAGLASFELPPGKIMAAVTGGAPSGLYARADQSKG